MVCNEIRSLTLVIVFVFWFQPSVGLAGTHWLPDEANLYTNRKFVELSHLLIQRNKVNLSKLILDSRNNLAGCKAIAEGGGGWPALLMCMKFIINESKLQISSKGSKKIAADLDFTCTQMAKTPTFSIEQVLKNKNISGVFGENQFWSGCRRALWKQIFLTAYANYEAEPIKSVALVRRAEQYIALDGDWSQKALRLQRN